MVYRDRVQVLRVLYPLLWEGKHRTKSDRAASQLLEIIKTANSETRLQRVDEGEEKTSDSKEELNPEQTPVQPSAAIARLRAYSPGLWRGTRCDRHPQSGSGYGTSRFAGKRSMPRHHESASSGNSTESVTANTPKAHVK